MGEEWRDIPGYEGVYRVSSHGRVYSMPRDRIYRGKPRPIQGGYLKGSPNSNGYLEIYLSRDGASIKEAIHRLVARVFIGPKPFDGAMVLHGDGNPVNNCVDNLRYGTMRENKHDSMRHGTQYRPPRKAACPSGHDLFEANVVIYGSEPKRQCKACTRAQGWAYTRRQRGYVVTLQDVHARADENYQKILRERAA